MDIVKTVKRQILLYRMCLSTKLLHVPVKDRYSQGNMQLKTFHQAQCLKEMSDRLTEL